MFPGLQILDQHRELIVVRIDGFYRDRILSGNLPLVSLQIQQAERHAVSPVQSGAQRSHLVHQFRLTRQKIAFFKTMAHALTKFRRERIRTFQDPVRLVQKNTGILRKIVEK